MHNMPHSEETKKKISLAKKGCISWNKGTKGLLKANATSFKKGQIPWNKGEQGIFVGEMAHNWKGGKHKTYHGYISIYKKNHPFATKQGRVPEHRLVVEKIIGRYLLSLEKVHHINKIRFDNRPKNLIAFVNQDAHLRFEKNCKIYPQEIIFDGRNYVKN